jgi:NAD-dependent DNA ligase
VAGVRFIFLLRAELLRYTIMTGAASDMESNFYNRVGTKRISDRQIDELIGLARGLLADEKIEQAEVECLQKWLAANVAISNQPLVRTLYKRINEILSDNVADENERSELLETLHHLIQPDTDLGESLKATSLPLDQPQPEMIFLSKRYCFTGTFNFGHRQECEAAVTQRGGSTGSLTQKTHFLVIGTYATESWKHSSFGNKILSACEWRDRGIPIAIVSENHWRTFL